MMDFESLKNNELAEIRIEQIISRAVVLFKRTGLIDLAEKWDRILKTYTSKKQLS
ncbi:MAG: hypothetical protein ACFFD5_05015 [Candidatus Thorarchaeota archaeon]